MKITIRESQFRRIFNNSKGWGLIGISEGKPKYSPDEEDDEIERIINDVEKTGKFIFDKPNPDYLFLINRINVVNKSEKFKNVLNQIREILIRKEDERIEKIIDNVKQTGEFSFECEKNLDYCWLSRKKKYGKLKEKFENVLNQIKEIKKEFEIKKIDKIIDDVRQTGEFIHNNENYNFKWLLYRAQNGNNKEKFKNALIKIREIEEEFENKKIERIIDDIKKTGEFDTNRNIEHKWLYDKFRRGNRKEKEKFENVLNQIREIQEKSGSRREWWGEKTTKKILEEMGFTDIPLTGQHRIDDCRNSLTCKQYAFDVYLPYNKTNYMVDKNIPKNGIIFEYDGAPHFFSVDFYGGDKNFIKRIHSDHEKNSYCKNNNIKLVRIPYTSKTRDDIERDIVLALKDPSNFVLTGDYPKLGWNK